mmetsp:Transcript_139093/g.242015  ORF Transcript_139093/g.242015 Transcript_139093/m.242015 type:complete len:284 (+) Transcript_139093:291-1142(+)
MCWKTAVRKIMFDCRRDSDALLHQLGIRIQGVYNLQVKEIMGRQENSAAHKKILAFLGKNVDREPHLYRNIVQLRGLKQCLADFELVDAAGLEQKKSVSKKFREDPEFWVRRPLPADALFYAEQDVLCLFSLDQRLPAVPEDDLKVASESYAAYFRDGAIAEERFVEHGYLPLGIVPGMSPLPSGTVQTCSGCLRSLPECIVQHTLKGSKKVKYCTLCYVIGVMHQNCEFAQRMKQQKTSQQGNTIALGNLACNARASEVKLCAFFRKPQGCWKGVSCKFAHA